MVEEREREREREAIREYLSNEAPKAAKSNINRNKMIEKLSIGEEKFVSIIP